MWCVTFFLFPVLLFTACGGGSGKERQPGLHEGNDALLTQKPGSSDSLDPLRRGQGEDVDSVILNPGCDILPHGKLGAATRCRLESIGLVNIAELDSSIAVSLLYATPHNFVGEVLYDDLTEAYLHPEAAEALLKAQRLLKAKHPDYTLIIYDATRPMSAQRKMWDLVKGTSKNIYVSNPARRGGLHNYGLAVDISILDTNGIPLPMGTEVNHRGTEANITNEAQLVKTGVITRK